MKFNFLFKPKQAVVNHEGAKAYRLSAELELYSAVATSMLGDTFYEKADDRVARIIELMQQVRPEFAARLAIYARKQMHLRSTPVVLATQLARLHQGDNLVSKTISQIVDRPDEITEVLAYYQMVNKREGTRPLKGLSKQVQKGLAASFNKFDEYQFAKYDRKGQVTLRDALFLVHPHPKDGQQQELFNKLAKNELATPYTWETELSAVGQVGYANAEEKQLAIQIKWEELLESKKLGYMALLRNLRNMVLAGVGGKYIDAVCASLTNPKAVERSKQLPFRFLAAYRELKAIENGNVPRILDALEQALQLSIRNMKEFGADEKVVIACDVSSSMQKPVTAKSKVLLYDIGLLMGMMLQSKCKNVLTGIFGDRYASFTLPAQNILANVDALYQREGEVGYATNGYLVIKNLLKLGYIADKVMLFTDMELWDHTKYDPLLGNTIVKQWELYKKIAPNAKLYLFDLAGHGKTPLRVEKDGVYLIAGWSDKIFEVMEAMEAGEHALKMIDTIAI